MNYLVIPNNSKAENLYPLIQLLCKFGVIAQFSSYGGWMSDNAYLNLPLLQDATYAMTNCLIIDYVVRSEIEHKILK